MSVVSTLTALTLVCLASVKTRKTSPHSPPPVVVPPCPSLLKCPTTAPRPPVVHQTVKPLSNSKTRFWNAPPRISLVISKKQVPPNPRNPLTVPPPLNPPPSVVSSLVSWVVPVPPLLPMMTRKPLSPHPVPNHPNLPPSPPLMDRWTLNLSTAIRLNMR
ncbi:hypothetical protein BC829DRAFT_395494 [Chytridium lagenaria]|nr:hypothetical protein BC829DRAFT_395494 [Chytridium lagenaria]